MAFDILKRCYEFVADPRVVSTEEIQLAASLFSDISPPDNAGPWFNVDHKAFLQFSSNDYLGLAAHPEIKARVVEVAQRYGIYAPMGSRSMTGTTCARPGPGTAGGRIQRMRGGNCIRDRLVGHDRDGRGHRHTARCPVARPVCTRITCMWSAGGGATTVFFRHNDLDHLEYLLREHASASGAAIIVDGVYSMQGDVAPLPELVELKHRYQVPLLVDDAHGTGVFGPQGRGTAAAQGVAEHIDLHAGTFSKAVGTIGGFVAGNATLIKFLRFSAPTYLFTKSMPLVVVAATQTALDLVERADEQREHLWKNAHRLQAGLTACGFDIGQTVSPITPVQFQGTEAPAPRQGAA